MHAALEAVTQVDVGAKSLTDERLDEQVEASLLELLDSDRTASDFLTRYREFDRLLTLAMERAGR